MAALRRTYVTYVLTLACSSADPSVDSTGLQGVYALDNNGDCNGQCVQEQIAGAALAQGTVWITRNSVVSQCNNGPCTIVQQSSGLVRASFDDGAEVISATPRYTSGNVLLSSGVGVTADGTTLYYAHGDPSANKMIFDALTRDGGDAGSVTQTSVGRVIGVVPDTQAAIVALANLNSNESADNSSDQGPFIINTNGATTQTGGLYRVDFTNNSISSLAGGTDFATILSAHLLAADATQVYWVSPGTVWSAPRDLSSKNMIGTFTAPASCPGPPSSCDVTNAVGLAVDNGVVALAILRGTAVSSCNNGPCTGTFTSSGCKIVKLPSDVVVYDDPTTACMGLAIDATDAYFATIEEVTVDDCCEDDGGLRHETYVKTTGIGRVSLTGTATKPASVFAIDTNRLYGPRRILVDDSYVYGIDPAYVLRVAKSSFK